MLDKLANRILIGCLVLGSLFSRYGFAGEDASQNQIAQRQAFLQAERYAAQSRDEDYLILASSLKDYPLYPFLHYEWLKNHLDDQASIELYLSEYADSRYAQQLLGKWLLSLAKQQRWDLVLNHQYPSNNPETQCLFALAQYHSNQQQNALDSAKQLWLQANSHGETCDVLFGLLKQSSSFDSQLAWQKFKQELTANNPQTAHQLLSLLSDQQAQTAKLWLKLFKQPELVKQNGDWKRESDDAGLIFAHTVLRLADTDLAAALATWDSEKQAINMASDTLIETENNLALALALKGETNAYQRLEQLIKPNKTHREWQIRAALREQNWSAANLALTKLDDESKQQDKWQYWQARALSELGQKNQAERLFQQLSMQRSFYGFLAAEKLQKPINLADNPIHVSAEEINQLRQQKQFQVVSELLALDRQLEAKRQWWFAIANLDKHDLAVAAKLAEQWQWPTIAIFTSAKANQWNDIALRFPLNYAREIQNHASSQQVDPALIFGLLRQESAFDETADSAVGAKGLMQVMPNTAKEIASQLKQVWQRDSSLFNPNLNIQYGSFYYKKLLEEFDQHPVLATAAYNAGPKKVKRWLPKHQALPADIWIELIPYKETRDYVSSVLQYSLIYQARLQRDSLKLTSLIRQVKPN
jgi:soluble lytic murein transglycosylase